MTDFSTTPEEDAQIARALGLRDGDPGLRPEMLSLALDADRILSAEAALIEEEAAADRQARNARTLGLVDGDPPPSADMVRVLLAACRIMDREWDRWHNLDLP
ncbi:MAG: hypothetical protein ACRDQX_01160 [Pseudonocardiaceae bacterium]